MSKILLTPLILLGLSLPAFCDTILPGTQIRVRADNPIDINRWDRGRIFPAHVAQNVYARDGDLAIPAGSYAELIVRQVGPERMALDLESITANGHRYVMEATGPNFHMEQRDYDSGNGLVGAIVGAIAGAAGAQVQTQGDRVFVPAGSMLTFQTQEPLHTVDWGDPGYQRDQYHYHRDRDWYR